MRSVDDEVTDSIQMEFSDFDAMSCGELQEMLVASLATFRSLADDLG